MFSSIAENAYASPDGKIKTRVESDGKASKFTLSIDKDRPQSENNFLYTEKSSPKEEAENETKKLD